MARQDSAALTVAASQEGSRWINERPSSEEVARWFLDNAPMHDGLDPERYVTGVTLIPQTEKYKVVEGDAIVERQRLTFTPYIKVETRVLYFQDLAELRGWLPVIEPDPGVKRVRAADLTNEHLPEGFFRMPLPDNAGKLVHYLCASYRVGLFEPDIRAGGRGKPVKDFAVGTKQVPTTGRYGADDNAVMKAQTGAIGRALGFLGMLVLPGSGVATAEDVQESMGERGQAIEASASLPEDNGGETQDDPAARAAELVERLKSEDPERFEQVQEWAKTRRVNLLELPPDSPQMRGVIRKLEKELEESRKQKPEE